MFVRSSHIAHAEVSLETAKEVIDKNSAIFLNAQEIVTHRPAQLSHHTTLPLHRDKHINYACSCKKKKEYTLTSQQSICHMGVYRKAGEGPSRRRIDL